VKSELTKRAKRAVEIVKQRTRLKDPAKIAVAAIEYDLSDRRGLKHDWQSIDEEIRENDIKPSWAAIIKEALK
jgi:hypothetical protein